jgi:diguanylate cyclase (GGDEF)-like protein
VARYGGEEFVVILPETDVEGAAAVAEEIRQAIHDMHVAHVKSRFGYVTASIGVSSSAHPAVHDGDALIRVADLAVYEAKSQEEIASASPPKRSLRHRGGIELTVPH